MIFLKTKSFLLFFLLCLSGCGGSSSDWRKTAYNLTADTTLNQLVLDVSKISGRGFFIDPELQVRLNIQSVDLPILLDLNVGQVLTLLQDMMPPHATFLYEEQANGDFILRPSYTEAENLPQSATKIIDFDVFAKLGFRNLISEPSLDEICGGSDDTLVQLGSGGIFTISTAVISDSGGHAPFVGTFPPLLELSISGNNINVFGDSPWVTVSGTIQSNGDFICTGSGTVAGFPNVQVDFIGQANPKTLNGTLTVGADGALPGGSSIIYSISP